MSVRKSERKEGDLAVINASRLLLEYTHDRVRDRNIFSKSERWLIPKNIWDSAVGARVEILYANGVVPECSEEARDRLNSQRRAVKHLSTLESMIDLCYMKHLIDERRYKYWVSLIEDTMNALRKWIKSDRRRYKSYLMLDKDIVEVLTSLADYIIPEDNETADKAKDARKASG